MLLFFIYLFLTSYFRYDLILGMGFRASSRCLTSAFYFLTHYVVRNTYTLIDFGNFADDTTTDRNAPFVQLLSITDVNTAHQDFVTARMKGTDQTGDPSQALLPASQGQKSPESKGEKKAELEEKVLSRWPYILMGSLLLFIIMVGLCIWQCCRMRRRSVARKKIDDLKGASALQMNPVNTPYKQIDELPPPSLSSTSLNKYSPRYSTSSSYDDRQKYASPYDDRQQYPNPHGDQYNYPSSYDNRYYPAV